MNSFFNLWMQFWTSNFNKSILVLSFLLNKQPITNTLLSFWVAQPTPMFSAAHSRCSFLITFYDVNTRVRKERGELPLIILARKAYHRKQKQIKSNTKCPITTVSPVLITIILLRLIVALLTETNEIILCVSCVCDVYLVLWVYTIYTEGGASPLLWSQSVSQSVRHPPSNVPIHRRQSNIVISYIWVHV